MADRTQELTEAVQAALADKTPLHITGGNTKAFYGYKPQGTPLPVAGHSGITQYEPTELVLTARAGTPLAEIEQVLADNDQCLAFEPPAFGEAATIGGTVACNLSGPARPYTGAARDFVLGVRMISGAGEAVRFGGEVMKNVAGYDAARLQCGALGTLGVLLEVSLKVLPAPRATLTLARECSEESAIRTMNRLAGLALPLSAACFDGNLLSFRLSGSETAIEAAQKVVGGEVVAKGDAFWNKLKEQRLAFFDGEAPLWRLSLAAATEPLPLKGRWLIDWGGAQRWLRSDEPAEHVQQVAERCGGHAVLFRGGDRAQAFQPLPPALLALHRRLKQAFDPEGIFNPGRLVTGM